MEDSARTAVGTVSMSGSQLLISCWILKTLPDARTTHNTPIDNNTVITANSTATFFDRLFWCKYQASVARYISVKIKPNCSCDKTVATLAINDTTVCATEILRRKNITQGK